MSEQAPAVFRDIDNDPIAFHSVGDILLGIDWNNSDTYERVLTYEDAVRLHEWLGKFLGVTVNKDGTDD